MISEISVKNIGDLPAYDVRLKIDPQLVRRMEDYNPEYCKCPTFLETGIESMFPGQEIGMHFNNPANYDLPAEYMIKISYSDEMDNFYSKDITIKSSNSTDILVI
jgi:hypothetical protein